MGGMISKSQKDNSFCVYLHRRKSDNSVFYVGHGRVTRALTLNRRGGRSSDYDSIVKTGDCYCQIFESGLSKVDAENIEEDLINLLFDMRVRLVNKLLKVSKSTTIKREDYFFLDYCSSTPGNLIWNQDRLCGSAKGRYLKKTKGKRAASLNKKTGYYSFRNKMAHRIVYAILHGECPSHLQVNHINGDKTNNKADNLELVTVSQNAKHAFDTGLKRPKKGSENHAAILTDDQVIEIYELLRQYKSNDEIAQLYNIEFKHVSLIRNGKRWKHLFQIYGHNIPPAQKEIKVTNEQIIRCLFYIECGMTNLDISLLTGVEVSTISRIRHGKIYKKRIGRLKNELTERLHK